jgi:molybdate transport system ATP-binding protein
MEVNSNYFNIQLMLKMGLFQKQIDITSASLRLGIMGPSGCGKSSLARALAGINPHFQGEFKFKDKTFLNIPAWERNFGYLPQDIQLIPHLTVEENILFPLKSQLLEEVIEGLQITHLLNRMPRNLSGGEKQRVGLTRALCAHSDLLILDEPFSSLDSAMKSRVIEFLDGFTGKRSLPMIVISHGEEELKALNCTIVSLDS